MAVTQAALELLVELKDQASSGLSSLGSTLGTVGTVAGGVALAGVAAFGAALSDGMGDAREAAQITAATDQAIAALGDTATVSTEQILGLASSLSASAGASLFGDDQVQAASNVLLKYQEIADFVPDLTALSVDMATRLGTEPAAAAETLGRALQSPFDAQAKLAKQGIILDEQQAAMLATMKETNDTAGAQALLMDILNEKYAGSAQAAADADGGVAQFWDRIGEAKETLGAAVLPLLNIFVSLLNDSVLPLVEQGAALFAELVGGLSSTGDEAGALGGVLAAVQPIFNDIQAAAAEVFNTLWTEGKPILDDLGTIAMPALAAAGRILASYWENILKPALMTSWDIFKNYILPAVGEVVHVLSIVLPPVIDTLAAVFTDVLFPALNGIVDALGWVGDKVNEVIGFFQNLGSSLTTIEIPDWLQGHSPPPLANWMQDIADASAAAKDEAGGLGFGGSVGALPAVGGTAGAGAVGGVTINVTVQGSVTSERDLTETIRKNLIGIGQANVSIFEGYA